MREPGQVQKTLAVVGLRDMSLSVSAVHGKSFHAGGVEYGHVIDPRTGLPSQKALLAAVVCAETAESDALSTALLVLGDEWLPRVIDVGKGMKGVLAIAGHEQPKTITVGFR